MKASDILIFVIVVLFLALFIYMNFIFPIKAEKEEQKMLEEQAKEGNKAQVQSNQANQNNQKNKVKKKKKK